MTIKSITAMSNVQLPGNDFPAHATLETKEVRGYQQVTITFFDRQDFVLGLLEKGIIPTISFNYESAVPSTEEVKNLIKEGRLS